MYVHWFPTLKINLCCAVPPVQDLRSIWNTNASCFLCMQRGLFPVSSTGLKHFTFIKEQDYGPSQERRHAGPSAIRNPIIDNWTMESSCPCKSVCLAHNIQGHISHIFPLIDNKYSISPKYEMWLGNKETDLPNIPEFIHPNELSFSKKLPSLDGRRFNSYSKDTVSTRYHFWNSFEITFRDNLHDSWECWFNCCRDIPDF